jgi:MFS family permease
VLSLQHFSPLWRVISISVVAHIALAGARITTSLYALSFHVSEFAIGSLIALFALFPMLFAVRAGRLVDRIGIAKPMIAGGLMMVAGFAIPCLTTGIAALYAAVVLIGTGFVTIHISTQHAVGSISTPDTRASNFASLALGYSISSFSGPVIAGFVIEHMSHHTAYAVFGGFALLSFSLALSGKLGSILLDPRHDANAGGNAIELLRDREIRRIYIVSILLGSSWDLFNFVMPIRGAQLGFSASTIGLILGSFSAATFAVRLAMHWVSRHYSEWQILTTALVLASACYALMPLMTHPFPIMLVTAALGLALGSSQSNVLVLLHHTSPAGRAGEAVGIRVTISNASQVLLPLAFGAAGATLGLFAVFWGMGAVIGSGVPLAWRKASEHSLHN